MSIELTYRQLNSITFASALVRLTKEKDFASFKAAYNVARIMRQFNKEITIAQDLYKKWTLDYIEKDENGALKLSETGPFPNKILPGKEEEFGKKWGDFLEHTVKFESDRILLSDLGAVKLSPEDLLILAPIFDFEKA